ncbi:MAG: alpha/beta hydrolase [Deltaproteobacteria bacterium]|nr:MAG: alpha/beta hydrolase [Deltaproteobacteria bacterium]
MNILVKIVTWSLFLYLVYCGFLFVMQRQVLFPRHLIELPSYNENISGLEKIWVATSSGKIETWFLPQTAVRVTKPAPAVIFAHGNGELIDFWPHELKKLNRLGIGVLLVEYPGYGRSNGSPSQKNITEAFTGAYDMLVTRPDVDPSRIVLFGRSLGGGAVCILAANRPSAALILMSSFVNIRSFASKYLVPGFLVRDPFDNLSVVSAYHSPILVVHGKFDEIIPFSHGMTLYKAAKQGKIITYKSGHNDCPPSWDIFWHDFETFLHDTGLISKFSINYGFGSISPFDKP